MCVSICASLFASLPIDGCLCLSVLLSVLYRHLHTCFGSLWLRLVGLLALAPVLFSTLTCTTEPPCTKTSSMLFLLSLYFSVSASPSVYALLSKQSMAVSWRGSWRGYVCTQGRPGAGLPAVNLKALEMDLKEKHGKNSITYRDVMSSAMYPQVFDEFK